MPKILDRVVSQLKAKGVVNPYAVGVCGDAEGRQPEEGNASGDQAGRAPGEHVAGAAREVAPRPLQLMLDVLPLFS